MSIITVKEIKIKTKAKYIILKFYFAFEKKIKIKDFVAVLYNFYFY
jgi:hypothetical protein